MISKAASATTGHQITLLERIILSVLKDTPKNSMSWKEEKETDLQRDLWQTPEEEVDEISDKLQTPQRSPILSARAFNM